MAAGKTTPLAGRPHLERVMRIAQDHIYFARSNPSTIAEIAERLDISEDAALAYAIAEQITDEFTLAERED
jgi:hypothetical protein